MFSFINFKIYLCSNISCRRQQDAYVIFFYFFIFSVCVYGANKYRFLNDDNHFVPKLVVNWEGIAGKIIILNLHT